MRLTPFRVRLLRRRSHWVLLLLCVLLGGRLWAVLRSPSREFDFTSPGPYRVLGIEDGETLLLDGNFAVRLLGVDGAAQANAFAAQAAELLRQRAEDRDITVALDRDRKDPQGRILAYVYCEGSLLNEELIRAGFFRADTSANAERAMAARLKRAEAEARQAGRGVWQRTAVSAR